MRGSIPLQAMPSLSEMGLLSHREPANVKNLIQNSYANDWITMTKARGADGTLKSPTTKARGVPTTRAAEGHAFGAHYKYLNPKDSDDLFKMSKFKKVPPKTDTHRGPLNV